MTRNRLASGVLAFVVAIYMGGCGGGGGGEGGSGSGSNGATPASQSAAGATSRSTDYTAVAMAGERLIFSVDTTNRTYNYRIIDSQYGLEGKVGSGTLSDNGNGTWAASNMPDVMIVSLPNGLFLGAIRESIHGVVTTVPVFGTANPVTTLADAQGTYNIIHRGCVNNNCTAGLGTFNIDAAGIWSFCVQGNLTTECPSAVVSSTLNPLGGGLWQVMSGSTEVGTALMFTANNQNNILLDLKDSGAFSKGMILGAQQQTMDFAQTDGTWLVAGSSGKWWGVFSASGGNLRLLSVNGVPMTKNLSLNANNPWEGVFTDSTGTHGIFANSGIYGNVGPNGYAEIGLRLGN
ncbi:MAG: hypothetical protein HQL63_11885 [Magnetococcales bacterium]|nr:hypothetical protein [Magnetococcales bacterium]MBF0321528.1 hypothetical protein [Magnetococcales bacterium]